VVDGFVNLWTPLTMLVSRVCGRHDAVVVDGLVNELADGTYAFGAGLRNMQGGQIRQYVQLLAAGLAAGAIILGLSMLPGSPAMKVGLPALVCGAGFAVVLRGALTSPGRERAYLLVLVTAFLIAMFPAGAATRVGWLALLTGLLTARLGRWTLDRPDERATAIPAALGLVALGWYLGSTLFVWGMLAGIALERLFRTVPREAAATFALLAALPASAVVPDSSGARFALVGWTLGLLTAHALGWIADAVRRQAEPAPA
jgi:hypothetical protein